VSRETAPRRFRLVAAFATVSGMTMLSRILGFVRDVMIARYLGAGDMSDAYVIAFRLPNLFRRWFAEGAFNAAFVPLFSRTLEQEGRDEARLFAGRTLTLLGVSLLIMTILAEIFMPQVMAVFAPGFQDTPEKAQLTVIYGRIMFPYLTFMALMALYGGVLNAFNRFAAAAFAPVMLNVVLIAALLFVVPHAPDTGEVLSWGIAVAGVVQWVVVFIALERQRFGLRPAWPRMTPRIKKLLVLMVPGILAGGVTQINIVVGSIIASQADGAVTYLYFADRIYQLPLGVIGAAIGVVLLPELARRLSVKDEAGARSSFNRAAELSMALTLPATVALIVIPTALIAGLFEGGKFTSEATAATAAALMAFAAGLPAYVLQRVLQPGYFAREDTVTPLKFAAVNVALNIGLSLYLFPRIGHVGLAIATAASAWVNVALLSWGLRSFAAFRPDKRLVSRIARLTLSALIMGGVLFGLDWRFGALASGDQLERLTLLVGLVGAGLAAFGISVLATRALTPSDLRRLVRRS